MWKLTENLIDDQNHKKRIYTNPLTNSKCSVTNYIQDKDGNLWWSFDELTAIPFTRQFAASKISALYALGLSKEDLTKHIVQLKSLLKSQDPEKYEKAYAEVIDFENKASNATDAVKQMSSLVTVYNTLNDEPIDSFDQSLQLKKISLLEADIDMHTFFLKRQIEATERFTNFLNQIGQIALPTLKENQVPSQ